MLRSYCGTFGTTEQSAHGVECGSDVHIEVCIDTTRYRPRSFYDGHGHPFLS
jgi:hypothetical protein